MFGECAERECQCTFAQCVVGIMASCSKLTALFSIQSQLDCALDDATTEGEKESLVHQYLKKLDEKDDLIIPDFEEGKSVNELSGRSTVHLKPGSGFKLEINPESTIDMT